MRVPGFCLGTTLVCVTLAACSGSDPSGPGGPLSGDWVYHLQDVRSTTDSSVCNFTGIHVQLKQRGSLLSGSASGGSGQCVRENGAPLLPVALQPAAIRGEVVGDHVSFQIGDFLQNQGTLAEGRVTGTGRFRPDAEGIFTLRRP